MRDLRIRRLKPGDNNMDKARIDPSVMSKFGIENGNIVELVSRDDRKIAIKAINGYQEDYDSGIVRVNGLVRKGLRSRIDDPIKVNKIDKIGVADEVTVSPGIDKNAMISTNQPDLIKKAIKQGLRGRNTHKEGHYFGVNLNLFSRQAEFKIENVVPRKDDNLKAYMIDEDTKINVTNLTEQSKEDFQSQNMSQEKENQSLQSSDWSEEIDNTTYEDIGGLNKELDKVREMVELPIRHPEIFETLGIEPPKGVLLYGPPGTGKTLLAKAVANETDCNFYNISGPEVISKFYGESEEQLREIFDEAEENSPSIIFIDEIDSIAPGRGEASGDVEKRVVSQLLSLMDGLESRGDVIVIAATNRVDNIDSALRRGGRFDREVEIGVPDKEGRKEILNIHTRGMPLSDEVDLDKLASKTHGFVGADIANLAKESAMNVLDEVKKQISYDEDVIDPSIYEDLEIDQEDFNESLKDIEPSAMREIFIETPEVSYDDVGGLEEVQQKLVESIEWPVERPDLFEKGGIEPPKGTLLYGPPGTGKTLLAKAVANESDSNFISVKGPELLNKYVGESEKGVRKVFKKARQNAPCVIFFDEIDAVAKERNEGGSSGENVTERVVSQLLTELDGVEKLEDVKVIATTNRPDLIDNALLRPGRFDNIVKAPMPKKDTRREILEIHTKDTPVSEDLDYTWLAENTKNYTGSDLESLCRESTMRAIRRSYKSDEEVLVEVRDFEEALDDIKPSLSDDIIEKYNKIDEELEKERTKESKSDGPRAFN